MRMVKYTLALLVMVSFGTAQACPDKPQNQTKSTKVEKPLAPKPSA